MERMRRSLALHHYHKGQVDLSANRDIEECGVELTIDSKMTNLMSSSTCFTIAHHDFVLDICLFDLNGLHRHEEVQPSLLEDLTRQIEADGVLKHPIIVDDNTRIVLDGNHRTVALMNLGCRRIPICLIDYRSPKIRVGSWYRTINGSNSAEALKSFFSQAEVKKSGMPNLNKSVSVFLKDGTVLLKSNPRIPSKAYEVVREAETFLRDMGLKVSYEAESEAIQRLKEGQVEAVIAVPSINKDEIIRTALSGKLFAPKTTRHMIPTRPMGVNVPLNLLRLKSDVEANERFLRSLKERTIKLLPPCTVLNGRRYDEDILLFE